MPANGLYTLPTAFWSADRDFLEIGDNEKYLNAFEQLTVVFTGRACMVWKRSSSMPTPLLFMPSFLMVVALNLLRMKLQRRLLFSRARVL